MAAKQKINPPPQPEGPMVTLEAAMHLLQENVTEWIWLQKLIQDNGGYLKFDPRRYKRFKIADLPYGQFFSHPLMPVLASVSPIYSTKAFTNLCSELERKSLQERSEWMVSNNELKTEFDEVANLVLAEPGSLSISTLRQIVAAKHQIERLPPAKREPLIRQAITFQCGVIACFYEFAAVGVTGRKMTTLVDAAINGCHDSFATATAMIPRLTSDNSELRRIYSMMQLDPELTELKQKVAARHKAPPFASRIEDKALWIGLSTLDGLNLLGEETARQDIFDGFERIGIMPLEDERHSVNTLNRAIGRYRRRQENFAIR